MAELLQTAMIEAVGLAVVVGLVMEAVKHAFLPNKRLKRLLPLLSMALGVTLGAVYAWVTGNDYLVYVVSGLVAGGFASGMYDVIESMMKGGVKHD